MKERFATVSPARKRAQRLAQATDSLLGISIPQSGGDEEGPEASSISSDGDASAEDAPSQPRRGATPTELPLSQGSQGARPKLRPTRQGMSASAWTKLLTATAPTRVILAAPVTFQAGLLMGVLQYNDARFGLTPCPLLGFCVQPPPSPSVSPWTGKHLKWFQAFRVQSTTHHTLPPPVGHPSLCQNCSCAAPPRRGPRNEFPLPSQCLPNAFAMPSLCLLNAIPMPSQCLPSGLPLPDGLPMLNASPCLPNASPMVFHASQWFPNGFPMPSQGLPNGLPMPSQWFPNGSPIPSQLPIAPPGGPKASHCLADVSSSLPTAWPLGFPKPAQCLPNGLLSMVSQCPMLSNAFPLLPRGFPMRANRFPFVAQCLPSAFRMPDSFPMVAPCFTWPSQCLPQWRRRTCASTPWKRPWRGTLRSG
jgi:hypothetical protein